MSHFEVSDKTKIYYNDIGQGHPVILIHGWPLNSDMWEHQALALLEKGFRVITYDRRGFGRSSQNSMNYDYNIFAQDLKELIDHLQLHKVSLVGFSMGGGEIARYMSRYGSQKISRVALISSVVPYLLKTEDNPKGVEENIFISIIEGLKQDRPHFLAGFARDFYGVGWISHPVSNEILQWTAFMAFQASAKATIDCVNAFGKTDFRPDMKSIDVPTLIIHGTADKTVPIEPSAAAAATMIPQAKYVPYDGAAHGLFLTHKQDLIDDLFFFLQDDLHLHVDAPRERLADRPWDGEQNFSAH